MKNTETEDVLNIFIEENLAQIRKNAQSVEQEHRVLETIIDPKPLSLPQFISIANNHYALDLRRLSNSSANNTDKESVSSSSSTQNIKHEIIHHKIKKKLLGRINILTKKGAKSAPLPDVTSENMEGFLSGWTNYLYSCAASAYHLASAAQEVIVSARKDPKNATLAANLVNISIDAAIKGSAGVGGIAKTITKVIDTVAGTLVGVELSNKLGLKQKDLKLPVKMAMKAISKGTLNASFAGISAAALDNAFDSKSDLADISAHGVLRFMQTGSISGAISSASKRAISKNIWRILDGKLQLNQMEFSKAGQSYFLSKEIADSAIKYFSLAGEASAKIIGEGVSSMVGEAGGTVLSLATEEAIKIAGSAAGLAILMAINSYLSQDKVGKEQNPELVKSTIDDISDNITRIKSDLEKQTKSMSHTSPSWRDAAVKAVKPIASSVTLENVGSKNRRIDSIEISTGYKGR